MQNAKFGVLHLFFDLESDQFCLNILLYDSFFNLK